MNRYVWPSHFKCENGIACLTIYVLIFRIESYIGLNLPFRFGILTILSLKLCMTKKQNNINVPCDTFDFSPSVDYRIFLRTI